MLPRMFSYFFFFFLFLLFYFSIGAEPIKISRKNSSTGLQAVSTPHPETPKTTTTISLSKQHRYTYECGEHQEIVCSVHTVDCDAEDNILPKINDTRLVPDEAHDLRIEPFAKAMSKQSENGYSLTVDISWQTPPNNSTIQLEAFLLTIDGEDERACFLFNVSETNWTQQTISHSPRFHFSTDSVFKFDESYDVTLRSLPGSTEATRHVHKYVTMPHNPGNKILPHQPSPNCTKYSHPFASKWTAGFRRIVVAPITKTIQIEFIGAPTQYCFEAYEVRLMHENGMEVVASKTIYVDNMKTEIIDNRTVYFGEYDFTNLTADESYIPSVIPVERASDGRCLCPVHGSDPYDNKVVCSCIAAQGKLVKMEGIKPPENEITSAPFLPVIPKDDQYSWWPIIFIVLMIASLILICFLIRITYLVYKRYRAHGKRLTIRFSHDSNGLDNGTAGGKNGMLQNGNAFAQTPLILNPHVNVLIIYSHDAPEHESAVMALADYLKDVFNVDVHVDRWDVDSIERNLMDYVSASVLNADKVIVINSVGASHRYNGKIMSRDYEVVRTDADPLEKLFLTQIDQALQHPCVISARFLYSSFNDVLPPLIGYLQYVVPNNLTPLVSAIVGRNLKNDPRIVGYNSQYIKLQTSISRMDTKRRTDPGWFDRTHCRKKIEIHSSKRAPAHVAIPVPMIIGEERGLLPTSVLEPLITENSELYSENVHEEMELQQLSSQPSTSSGSLSSGVLEEEDETASMLSKPESNDSAMMEEEDYGIEEISPTTALAEIPLKIISSKIKNGHRQHEESNAETPVPIGAIQSEHSLDREKFGIDSTTDSGVVSDIDLRLVSA